MASLNEKLANFEVAKAKAEALQAAGVDLRSSEAARDGAEFLQALDELAQEFGYKILKPIERDVVARRDLPA